MCDGILQCKDGQDEENCSKYKCFLLDFNTGSPLGMLSKLRLFSFLFWLRNEKKMFSYVLLTGGLRNYELIVKYNIGLKCSSENVTYQSTYLMVI